MLKRIAAPHSIDTEPDDQMEAQPTAFAIATAASSPFSKLSDLTSFHLQNSAAIGSNGIGPTFRSHIAPALNIPKLNVSRGLSSMGGSSTRPTPSAAATLGADEATTSSATPRSLRQIMESQKIQLTEMHPATKSAANAANEARPTQTSHISSTIIVNLSAATNPASPSLRSIASRLSDTGVDDSMLQTIPPICHPCDAAGVVFDGHRRRSVNNATLLELAENLTHECLIDCAALATPDRQLLATLAALKTANCSRVARVLCTRYADRSRAERVAGRVRHEFAGSRNRLAAYAFDKPSPDDLVQRQLAKWKKM